MSNAKKVIRHRNQDGITVSVDGTDVCRVVMDRSPKRFLSRSLHSVCTLDGQHIGFIRLVSDLTTYLREGDTDYVSASIAAALDA